VAIYNALKRHPGQITVWIDGIAASAASYIAMAGDEIVMPENAFLMIHDPSGLVMGTAAEMREMAGTMDKIAGSMIRGYAERSGKPDAEIAALMAAETWFDAQEALAAGLATRVIAPVRIAASFDVARFRNAPPEVVEAASESDDQSKGDADDGDLGHVKPLTGEAAANAVTLSGEDGAGSGVSDGNTRPSVPSESSVEAANTAPHARAIRAEAIAHARAVIDLCRLAGQPQMAGRFLEEEASLDEVRSRLLADKAEASPDITAVHAQPGRAATTQSWGDVIARTFKTKG
jgi:enoyl-CoA hydratase/carnithine racemase